jgi:uncharacterized protein (DUF2132 family)
MSDFEHPKDLLHGVSLEMIIDYFQKTYGWEEMGERISVRCFLHDPTMKSSLTFLRKTPWARKKIEDWYKKEKRQSRRKE